MSKPSDIVITGTVKREGKTWTAHVVTTWRDRRDTWRKDGFATEDEARDDLNSHLARIAAELGRERA